MLRRIVANERRLAGDQSLQQICRASVTMLGVAERVAVESSMPDGDLDMLLFDPKYKLDADDQGSGLPVKSDVDKMHSYRDAIRDGAGRHVVSFAATLYPGTTQHYGSDIAAIGAVPGRENELGETLRETLWRHIGEARDRQGSLSGEGSVTDV